MMMLDAVHQNTPGYAEVRPLGVPKSYSWYRGAFKPPNTIPPPSFTAMSGWGQVYPRSGEPTARNHTGTVEVANARAYVRLKSTHQWVLVQDQARNPLVGANFVVDFRDNLAIPTRISMRTTGTTIFEYPPKGYNVHFWFKARGTYDADTVDGVYVRMDMRVSKSGTGLVANIGADWWRDPTAGYEPGFANNPGAGMSNWIRLSVRWTTLHFFSVSTPEFRAAPPPPFEEPTAAAPAIR
jgi:hypothetical protein